MIAVTSAEPSEGKSFIATHLAIILATGGRSVLLIDADLRKPVLHEAFNLPRTPGLTDVLIGAVTLDGAVHKIEEHGIHVLAAGTTSRHPAELVGHAGFAELLALVKARYEMVVVDTPPVMAVTDPTLIGRSADAVLLVGRANKTSKVALRMASEELRRLGCEVVGLALNDVTRGRFGSRYGAYGPHYGGYAAYNVQGRSDGGNGAS